MSKVIKCNVILRGREFKAGIKESDLPIDVRKDAAKFLIDEKKYKAAGQPEAVIEIKAQEQIDALYLEIDNQKAQLEATESCLSEANSSIAGLTSQLEDAVTAEDVEAEKQRADDAEGQLVKVQAELKEAIKAAKKQ